NCPPSTSPPAPPPQTNSPAQPSNQNQTQSTNQPSITPIQVTTQQPCCSTPTNCPPAPQPTPCVTYVTIPPIDQCHCPTYRAVYGSGPCDDGNPCTVDDHCENGLCVGTPVQITFSPNP